MREPLNVSSRMSRSRLLESPVVALRRQHGLSPSDTAALLGISVLRLARLEAETLRLPTGVLRDLARAMAPARRYLDGLNDGDRHVG
jgi:hypothetical protein